MPVQAGTALPSARGSAPVPSILECSLAALGDFAEETLISVACARASSSPACAGCVFTLTSRGQLLCFDGRRVIDKWVDLKMPAAFAVTLAGDKLGIAGSDGLCRVFAADSFRHLCTLPRPAPLGQVFVDPPPHTHTHT